MGAFAINQSRYDIAKCREREIYLGCLLKILHWQVGYLYVISDILILSYIADKKRKIESLDEKRFKLFCLHASLITEP